MTESWTAFRFEDCSRILRSAKIFSSTGYDSTIGLVMGHMILGMDDPEHRMHRNLVANAFREKSLARWEHELIGPICNELIDRFARRGFGRARPGAHLRVPGAGDRPAARAARGGLRPIPTLVHRADRAGRRHRAGAGRLAEPQGLLRRRRGRTAPVATRGRHQRSGHGRHRRREADRRGHQRLPAAAAPGRRRDDLPIIGEPAVPPAHPPRPTGRRASGTGHFSIRPSRRVCGSSRPCS